MERAKYTGEAAARAELGTPQSKPGWLESQHSLPFQFLSPDEFELFCYLLLFRENPGEDIFYYGKTGDAGRDIVRIKEDGSVELIQCKHYQSNVGIGEIKTEISKLYVNLHKRIIPERPDKVTFYVVPDLTAPAQDLINHHSKWIDIAESALKEYLKKEPTSELLDFALSWHPQFSKETAIDLTQRVRKHKDLVEEFFRYKKVIDSEDPKLDTILEQGEINKLLLETLLKRSEIFVQPNFTNVSAAMQELLCKSAEENPGLAFTVTLDEQTKTTVLTVAAKAAPINFGTLVFPNTESGRHGKQKFKVAIEEGRAVELEPTEYNWRWDFNLPEIGALPLTIQTLSLRPNVPKERIPVRLDVLRQRESVASVSFTYLRIVRAGTQEIEFHLENGQFTGKATFVFQLQEQKTTLNLSEIDLCSVKAEQAKNQLALMFALYQGGILQITSLDNNAVLFDDTGIIDSCNISEEEFQNRISLLNSLIKINCEFGLDIRYPETIDDDTVKRVELVVDIMEKGEIELPRSGIVRILYNRQNALRIIDSLRLGSSLSLSMDEDNETDCQLLDHVLPMGKTKIYCEEMFLINGLQGMEQAIKEVPESDEIEIALRYERAIRKFMRWLPEATNE